MLSETDYMFLLVLLYDATAGIYTNKFITDQDFSFFDNNDNAYHYICYTTEATAY